MSAERGMTEWRANGVDYTINDPNIAEEFDPTKTYHVRDHVYYQGNLYVFVAEHAAGAWNTSHVLLFKVGTELANLWNANDTEATLRAAADNDLKSAFNNTNNMHFGMDSFKVCPFEQGIISNNGGEDDYDYSCRSKDYMNIAGCYTVSFTASSGFRYGLRFYDINKTFLQYTAMTTSQAEIAINSSARYMRLVIMKSGGDTIPISPSECDALGVSVTFNKTIITGFKDASSLLKATMGNPNPLEPLMFDWFYWAKGSHTQTLVTYSTPLFVNADTSAYNAATAGSTIGYGYFSYKINDSCQFNKLSSSTATIDDLVFFIKCNISGSVEIYLSTGPAWGANYSSCKATAELKNGINVVKPTFAYYQDASSSTKYQYIIVVVPIVNDIVLDISAVKGDIAYNWVKEQFDSINSQMTAFDADLIFWGDSLTMGYGGDGTTYPEVCSEALNMSFINYGHGGESSNTIAARQGGNSWIIPAGSVNGDYTKNDMVDVFGGYVTPLRQIYNDTSAVNFYVNNIECTLARKSQTSPASDDVVYTVSGYTGDNLIIPTPTIFIGASKQGKITCIFIGTNGTNGITAGDTGEIEARITIIDSMIAHIKNKQYVVLGLSNGSESARASEDQKLLEHYGNNFFPTRKMLVNYGMTVEGLTPTADDQTYINAGIVPPSLRVSGDATHLNAYGYHALGIMLADKIRSLGFAV